jgi:hypothetical protein
MRIRFGAGNKGSLMPRELMAIADELKAGRQVDPITVRSFLAWFQAQRREFKIVREIRRQLSEAGVVTVLDLESQWVDSSINFELASSNNAGSDL